MWRIHGILGRVLSRCHANAPLRLSQGHHVEDDVISTSTLLSTGRHPSDSSQSGKDRERKRRKRSSQFCYSSLPRYSALDAMGWGAAAVLFMQICRRLHSGPALSESNPEPAHREPGLLQKCGYRVLLEMLSRKDILPRGPSVKCLGRVQEDQGSTVGHALSDSPSPSDSEGVSIRPDSSHSDPLSSSDSDPKHTSSSENTNFNNKEPFCPEEEELIGAANNLKHIADSSVPVILNIIGIESARSGDDGTAFTCFLASAQHGYCKAQFNAGVCYEKGRGVGRDKQKAAEFYRQAATGGHSQAKYRYAKHLLQSRGQQSAEEAKAAMDLLEEAAGCGVREAQAYLGVLFSQPGVRDGLRAVHYLRMAAENGDSLSRLYLGQCYEWGFGVQQCFRTAVELYQQAAAAGNLQAECITSALCSKGVPADAALRPIRSTPCFSTGDRLQFRSAFSSLQSDPLIQPLPHSWSTGSLLAQAPPYTNPLSEGGGTGRSLPLPNNTPCGWTIGVG
ncbi:death ligand signal enhancer isoform X2 [Megalops cyprinoides]|uniref:death ligand signal enhancer isoform X2 n=1 Tax=Megalops cyprinoides TaxID=118141 RepID=UPI0018653244|nr:death ligand signal enhancer isoform X2 [Megalops cyprinoides]